MTHIADRALLQDATTWPVTPDEFGGDNFGAPIPIKVRWSDRTEKFISSLDQNEHISSSIVHTDRTLAVGDYIYLGTTIQADPSTVVGAYKIRRFDNIPDIRTLLVTRKAYL